MTAHPARPRPHARESARRVPTWLAAVLVPMAGAGVAAVVAQPADEPFAPSRMVIDSYQIDRFEAIGRLQRGLSQDPDELIDWVILGELAQEVALDVPTSQAESYLVIARQAYGQALRLKPDDDGIRAALDVIRDQQGQLDAFQGDRDGMIDAYLDARRRELARPGASPMLRDTSARRLPLRPSQDAAQAPAPVAGTGTGTRPRPEPGPRVAQPVEPKDRSVSAEVEVVDAPERPTSAGVAAGIELDGPPGRSSTTGTDLGVTRPPGRAARAEVRVDRDAVDAVQVDVDVIEPVVYDDYYYTSASPQSRVLATPQTTVIPGAAPRRAGRPVPLPADRASYRLPQPLTDPTDRPAPRTPEALDGLPPRVTERESDVVPILPRPALPGPVRGMPVPVPTPVPSPVGTMPTTAPRAPEAYDPPAIAPGARR